MGDYQRPHEGALAWEAEDGVVIYSASAMGSCEAELLYSRRGIQPEAPPDWLQKKYEEGKREEKKVIDAFCKEFGFGVTGWPEEARGGLIVINSTPGEQVFIQCHYDEIEIGGGKVVEVKLLADSTLKTIRNEGDPLREHYMHQMCCYDYKNGKKGVYWVLASKTKEGEFKAIEDVIELDWEEDLKGYWLPIRKKISKVEKAVREHEEIECSMPGKYPCFYTFMQPERKEKAKKKKEEEREVVEDKDVAEWVEMRYRFHQQAKVAEQSKQQYDGLLKEKLGVVTKTRRMTTKTEEGLQFNFTQVPMPKQVDWDRLKEFIVEKGAKWDEFLKESEGSYFLAELVEGEKGEKDE